MENKDKVNFVRKREGKLVDYYRVGKELGSGSFGEVRRVVHIETGEQRAVKVIKKDSMDQEEQDTLYNEINVLRNLDHPNIVKVFEYFEDEKRFFIVTEVVQGGELFDQVLKKGHLNEEEASKVMRTVLACVNYCHQHKIVHRDLKPENILLEKDQSAYDELKIIDFGTSKYYDPETHKEEVEEQELRNSQESLDSEDERQAEIKKASSDGKLHEVIGTPYYIAPEVLQRQYGAKCDVWSCGVIAFMLLSGTVPFNGHTPAEVMQKVRAGKWKFKAAVWNGISEDAKDFVSRLLTFDQNLRPSAQEIIGHKWIQQYF